MFEQQITKETAKGGFTEPAQLELTPTLGKSIICAEPPVMTPDSDEVDMSDLETPPTSDIHPYSFDLTDFSHYIALPLDGMRSNASSLTVCDLESYTRVAARGDLYGWEAELKRKVESELESGCTSPADTIVCTSCLGQQQRRHTRQHKRNLLQRVFSSLGEPNLLT